MPTITLDGRHYGELFDAFGLDFGSEDEYPSETLERFLLGQSRGVNPKVLGAVELCREYVDKMIPWKLQHHGRGSAGVFMALANMEDDDSFMEYFAMLLPKAWV